MEEKPKLVKVKSIDSEKTLNFATKTNLSLQQIRDVLINSGTQFKQFQFLMQDKSPIAKFSQKDIELGMILDSQNCFYVKFENSGEPDQDIAIQKKYTQTVKIYEQFEQKVKIVKEKIEKFKAIFTAKINGLPVIDAHYQGEIDQNGQYQGIGRYIYNNGQVHIGEWKNSKRHGLGSYTFSNGNKYEGEYKDGVACGIGVEYLGENSLAAIYKNNNSNGMGIYYNQTGEKFLGSFVQNMFEGLALHTYPDGTWAYEQYSGGYLVNNDS